MVSISNYMICNFNMMKNHKILDFLWSSKKDYNSLRPLYRKFVDNGWQCRLLKIHRNKYLNYKIKNISKFIVLAYSGTYYRLIKSGWDGKYGCL